MLISLQETWASVWLVQIYRSSPLSLSIPSLPLLLRKIFHREKEKSISRQLLKRKVSGLKEKSENIPRLFHRDLTKKENTVEECETKHQRDIKEEKKSTEKTTLNI